MKTFSTNGTGSQQTLSEIESDKMPIYNTMADAEADLANLEEGQLVGIEDTGDELAQPVDVVEEDNLHAVTSNAVANAIKKEYIVNNDNTLTGSGKYDLIKCGNVMELNIYNLSYASSVGDITPVVIPSEYRPSRSFTVAGNYGSGSLGSSACVLFVINANGNVSSYTYSDFTATGSNNLHAVWTI